jgi:TonB family protein
LGVRLVIDTPTGERRFPAPPDGSQSNGGAGNAKRVKGTLAGPQFSLLSSSAEDRKRRWLVLGFSPVFEGFAIAIMFWALMSLPPSPKIKTAKEEVLYFHIAPPPAPVNQHPRLLERPAQPPPVAATPILPRLRREEIQKPVAEQLKIPRNSQPRVELPKRPPAPKPAETFTAAEAPRPMPKRQIAMVHTGAFNPGSMAKGTVKRPLREVQTGGFGANNGIPNDPAADSRTRVAQLGSFDLPSGPGEGNGTGGARGVRGTVASAGFGNGIGEASGSRPNHSGAQSVHQGGFGSVVTGTKAPQTHSAAPDAAFKPVVILAKPDPVYPPEARRDHIEGQVILSVLFGASGNLRVLKVEHGLGHGMDAAAIEAAEQIKFKPAERDGRPVDSTAMVHIIFQLAY